MKKITSLLLVVVLILSFCSCSNKTDIETVLEPEETIDLEAYSENLLIAYYELGMLGSFVDTTCYFIGTYWETAEECDLDKDETIGFVIDSLRDDIGDQARTSMNLLDDAMTSLEPVPEEYEEAYEALMTAHNAYLLYPEWRSVPEGNRISYVNSYEEASENFYCAFFYLESVLSESLEENNEELVDTEPLEALITWYNTKESYS